VQEHKVFEFSDSCDYLVPPFAMFHLEKLYDEDVQLLLRLRSFEPRRSFFDIWVAQLSASGVHNVRMFGTFIFATLTYFPLRALDKNS
jgi:hypothetical protein